MRFFLLFLLGSALHAASFVWVSQNSGDQLDVIDGATNNIIETISSADFSAPERVIFLPNGKFVYVVNYNNGKVCAFDANTYEQVATIETGGGGEPFELAASPNSQWVYVPGNLDDVVYVISTGTNIIETTIDFGMIGNPLAVAFSPDGTRAYVTDDNGSVTTINTSNHTIIRTDPTGLSSGTNIAVAPNGLYAYIVDDSMSNQGSKLNLQTFSSELFLVGANGLGAVVFSPDGLVAYISAEQVAFNIGVYVIDTTDSTVLRTISSLSFVDPYGLSLSQDGKFLYCADYGANLVFKIDTNTFTVAEEIANPGAPVYLAAQLFGTGHQRSFQRPSNRRPH